MIEAVVGPYTELSARNSILTPRVEIAGTGEMVERTCPDHMLIHGRHASGCVSSVEITGGENRPLLFELRGPRARSTIEGQHPGGYQCGDSPCHFAAGRTAARHPPAGPCRTGDQRRRAVGPVRSDIRSGSRTVPDFAVAAELHALLDAIDRASDEGRTIATR